MSRADVQKLNKPKTHHGKTAFFAKGGDMAESKQMAKKELAFMKNKGAPKSMIKHEKQEMAQGYAKGGFVRSADGIAKQGKTKARQVAMKRGGRC